MGLGAEVATGNPHTHVCVNVASRAPVAVIRVCAG